MRTKQGYPVLSSKQQDFGYVSRKSANYAARRLLNEMGRTAIIGEDFETYDVVENRIRVYKFRLLDSKVPLR